MTSQQTPSHSAIRTPLEAGFESYHSAVEAAVSQAMPTPRCSGAIAGQQSLRALGITSLRFVGLIVALEEELGLDETALRRFHPNMTFDELVVACDHGERCGPASREHMRDVNAQ